MREREETSKNDEDRMWKVQEVYNRGICCAKGRKD